jgi:cardiolipin synthase
MPILSKHADLTPTSAAALEHADASAHLPGSRSRAFSIAAAASLSLMAAGCATLPDTQFLSAQYTTQAARFQGAWGPLSAQKSAAIVAQLKGANGDLDVLDKQTALEQAIVGSALVVGNKVTLLQDGPATYQAMFAAIRRAKDHINIESYIIEDGEVGQQFAELLLERQANGVQVNVIYDSVGAFGTGKPFFDRLTQAGVQVLEFNPVNPLAAKRAWSPNHRDHRKLLVVDGSTAFLGGINISSVYSSGSSIGGSGQLVDPKTGWRDTDIQIDGPVALEFQKLFVQTWDKQKGKPLAQKDYFPVVSVQGKDIVRAIGSTPDDPFSLVYLTLISAITNAEKQVYITNAYFVPDPQLMKALLDAAGRGVDVRLILPSQSDSKAAYYAGRSHYAELLDAGVKIYERRGALLHVKTAIVDGVWSCVGSSNLDWRSALDNDEINAVILGREFAQQMQAAYAGDIEASDAIDIDSWGRRSILSRLNEVTARLWGRLL